jgi:penicillin-binding protein 2
MNDTHKLFRRGSSVREHFDVDEIFFDSFQLKSTTLRWEHRLEALVSRRSLTIVATIILAVVALFSLRVLHLGVGEGKAFELAAQRNHIKEIWARAPRGIIYDNARRPMVVNSSAFDLVVIPAEIPREREPRHAFAVTLSRVTGMSARDTEQFLAGLDPYSYLPVPVRTHLSREDLIQLQDSIREFSALRTEENLKRTYPAGRSVAHTVGYVGRISEEEREERSSYLLTDLIGKAGVEQVYEDALRGTYGKTEVEVDAQGREGRLLSKTEPSAGKNIVLFLDLELQKKLTEVMERVMHASGKMAGAAAVVDVRTGGVLAMQSFPTYDSNYFSETLTPEAYAELFDSPDRPLFNRAVSGLYPPGSTIKPFMAIAGLDEKVIDERTTVYSGGSITVAGQEFEDWRAHGTVDVRRALAVSSNIFFYALGGGYGELEGLGPYRIKEYLSRFNFDGEYDFDFPGTVRGLIPDPEWKKKTKGESWYIGDTYNTSIGQGYVSISPLHLAMATAAIANDGVLMSPRMVRAIYDQDFSNEQVTQPVILRSNFVSQDSLRVAREGMRASVVSGYTQSLQDLPVPVAAKTGSAQNIPGRPEHSWVTIFAPYENPEIAMTLLVEQGGFGGGTVISSAHETLNWYFGEYRK